MKTKSLDLDKNIYQNKLLNIKLDEKLQIIKDEALKNDVPIIQDEGLAFLIFICEMIKPKRILEIGCAVGFSSAVMATFSDAYIDTMEIDPKMVQIASLNHQELNLDKRINIIYGDALNGFDNVKENHYDLIFIDAAKGKYIDYFNLYKPLLNQGGIIITDNLYFHDLLFEETDSKNLYGLISKIDKYNNFLLEQEDFSTHIFKIGDGISVSVKK